MNRRRRKKIQAALTDAVLSGDIRRVRSLLRSGADPDTPARDGGTPLYLASVQNQPGIARLLLAAGAAPNAESAGTGQDGLPLCAAACWGHDAVVVALLAHGADPDLPEDHGEGWTALHWAERNGHHTTLDLLRTPRR